MWVGSSAAPSRPVPSRACFRGTNEGRKEIWLCTKIYLRIGYLPGGSAELTGLRRRNESQKIPRAKQGRLVGSSSFLAGPNRGRSTRRTLLGQLREECGMPPCQPPGRPEEQQQRVSVGGKIAMRAGRASKENRGAMSTDWNFASKFRVKMTKR